jgi:hypothetical protein
MILPISGQAKLSRSQDNMMAYVLPRPRSGNILLLVVALFVVFCLHSAMEFLLYRGRVIGHWTLAESDFVLFAVPSLLALVAYAILFARWARARQTSLALRVVVVFVLTLVVTFFSFWGSMLIPINVYGM